MLNLPGLDTFWSLLLVLLSFSALIFVHELGHYLACRLIGVRVERFFIGFDAWGLALQKKINGTVYGIGVIPLGGYVKPAGQADDPRQQRITGAPDELPSKSLPAQALMFSAGVLMNFLFGYLLLVCAYLYGIPFTPPILGKLLDKGQADTHDLEPGDRILSINGRKVSTFEDISSTIFDLADEELVLKVQREPADGSKKIITRKLSAVPNEGARGKIPYIGAAPAATREVAEVDPGGTQPELRERIQPGDKILAINGVAIPKYHGHRVQELVENLPGERISVRVEHADGTKETVRVRVAVYTDYAHYDLGLRFDIPIAKVTDGFPAADAGLERGDVIWAIRQDGKVVFLRNDTSFRERINRHALTPITLTVQRNGEERRVADIVPAPMAGDPRMPSEADTLLGLLAEPVVEASVKGFRVVEVFSGKPVADRVQTGDILTAINGKTVDPDRPLGRQIDEAAARTLVLLVKKGGKGPARPVPVRPRIHPKLGRPLIGLVPVTGQTITHVAPGPFQHERWHGLVEPGTRVLRLDISQDLKTTTIEFVHPETGRPQTRLLDTPDPIVRDLNARTAAGLQGHLYLSVEQAREIVSVESIPAAMQKAAETWVEMAGLIYTVLHRLATRRIPLDAVGGPVLLFRSIQVASEVGFGMVLYLVALISVNLGVINLLPFPVLDGGHLLFLFVEWVKGSPPSDRIKEYAQYVGIVCILALILTVTWYDLLYWLG